MIRVLIADDHPVVRTGLAMILSKDPKIVVVGAVKNGRHVIDYLRSNPCDVLVLDIAMPGMSGLEVMGQLKRGKKEVRVLILSIHKEEMYASAAFKAGAAGYLTKECAPDELITAVKKIASGGNYVSLFLAEKMAFEIGRMRAGKAPHETLTGREFQVMRMIAAGLTPKKIAGELYLSVKTINSYRIRILEKMNIKTNAELIRYALENKLIE
jgi:DNA-binding NarL/FixJ family response regulator